MRLMAFASEHVACGIDTAASATFLWALYGAPYQTAVQVHSGTIWVVRPSDGILAVQLTRGLMSVRSSIVPVHLNDGYSIHGEIGVEIPNTF